MPRQPPIILLKDEAPSEIIRASHLCECEVCGQLYIDHQLYCFCDENELNTNISQMKMPLFLHKVCNGKLYKL